MIKKILILFSILLITGRALSQNLELIRLKYSSTLKPGGGCISIYYFMKGFNQKNTADWETIKKEILGVLAESKNINQLNIYFLNKAVYDFDDYPKNSFSHPVPDTEDLFAITIGNKSNSGSDTRCVYTVTMNMVEPEPGYLSKLCLPSQGSVALE